MLNTASGILLVVKKWYLPLLNNYPGTSAFWCMYISIALSISWKREVKLCPRVLSVCELDKNLSSTTFGQVSTWPHPETTSPIMPRSGPWRPRLFRVSPQAGAALGTPSSVLPPWAYNGDRLLVTRRRVRRFSVRREARAAAWTACVLPRQALRAAGERVPAPRASSSAGTGTSAHLASALPLPPTRNGRLPIPNRGTGGPLSRRQHEESPLCRPLAGLAVALWSYLRPRSTICNNSRVPYLISAAGQSGPPEIRPPPTFQTSVCLSPRLTACSCSVNSPCPP